MNVLKENANSIVFCLFELVVGILLMINPVGFTSGIIVVAGVGLMAAGLLFVYKYFITDVVEAAKGQMLTKGLLLLLIGTFCALKSNWFVTTFPVLTIIYGIGILVTGCSKVQLAIDMLRQKNEKWFWAGINAAVSIVCAIVILSGPFPSTVVLWMFTGISLMVEAIFDIITMVVGHKEREQNGN